MELDVLYFGLTVAKGQKLERARNSTEQINFSNMGFEHLSARSVISCKGSDTEKFLQGLFTNDVNQKSCYAMMLSPLGRYLFDFFVCKLGADHYLIDSQDPALMTKMLQYRLHSSVEISDASDEYTVLYSQSDLSSHLGGYAFADPRYSRLGFRCIVPVNTLTLAKEKFTYIKDLYLMHKYEHVIPDGYPDMQQDKSFPLEFGLAELQGVSHTKGCYLGQESIARTYNTGVVRKHVYKVFLEEEVHSIKKGAELLCEDEKIGTLCSTYGRLGIALIRTQDYHLGKVVHLGDTRVLLELAPWYDLSKIVK